MEEGVKIFVLFFNYHIKYNEGLGEETRVVDWGQTHRCQSMLSKGLVSI